MLLKEASELDGRPDKVLFGAGSYRVKNLYLDGDACETQLSGGRCSKIIVPDRHSTEKLALEEER